VTRTTMGRLLVDQALPEDLRDPDRVLDKKGIQSLLRTLAERHPDKYAEVSKKLSDIGRTVATEFGGYTFGLEHLRTSAVAKKYRAEIQQKMQHILGLEELGGKPVTPEMRKAMIVKMVGGYQQKQIDDVYAEAVKANNPLALQVVSGSRGNKMNLASLLGSDLLYSDHRDEVIPLPVLNSYSQGLSPIEYWAATYGARRGTMATKFATADAGFLSKQLNQVAHRLMVVDEDDPRDTSDRGLPVDTDDDDNEGALLARDVGPYKRDTVLSPKILKHLKGLGHDRLLVRSPLLGGSPDGGVYARDVGVRERGTLPGRGEMVGLTAAQALSEPLSQGQLSAKHSGGVAGQEKAVGGFAYINQLIQVPEKFKGGATHAEHDGTVSSVDPAPAGGHYVWVDDKRHYVPAGVPVTVKKGDAVEAGDVISEGFPHPAVVVEHKGIGEGKRYFVNAYRDAARAAGMKVNRRNVELLARGLINHVTLTDELGGHVPDDVLPYSTVEHVYEPRPDHARVRVGADAVGKYLEAPVLHYSIGTKIRPSVLKELQHFNIGEVAVHPDPPPFTPRMIRGMYSLQHDPDWMTRMYGSGLKSSLLDAAHRGATSDELGTSFVPGLARAAEFGRVGTVRQPQPGAKPPAEGQPFGDPRRPSPPAATPAPPAPAKPKKTGLLSGWFKGSADRGTAKPVTQIKQTAKPRHVRIAEQIRGVRMTKTAQQPQVDSTVRPNTGSSTSAPTTTTRHVGGPAPAGPGGIAHGPTPALPASAFRAPSAAGGVAPADFWHTPPQPSPSAPPGQVHPARAGAGMLGSNDDPDQAAAFVHGNGFGGEFGQATRLGSLLDTSATSALTAGSAYVPGQYSGAGSDDLIGGDRSAGVTAAPPPVATPAPGMSGLEIARGMFGPGGLATGAGVSVAARGLAAAAGRPLAGGVLGGVLKPLGRLIPGVGTALEVADAATMTPQESRQRFDDKVTGKLDVRLPFGIVLPGNSVPGYLADNFLSPGRNIRAMGTTLADAVTDTRQSDADVSRMAWRAAVSRAGALSAEIQDFDLSARRRPLTPQETSRLTAARAELARVRTSVPDQMPGAPAGTRPQTFQAAVDDHHRSASARLLATRTGEGAQARPAVLGGTATPAQQDAFEVWLATMTGSGRVRGEPTQSPQGLPAPTPDDVDGRGNAHRTSAEGYVRQMTDLATEATARGRGDIARRAAAAAEATRAELTAWTQRHALPGFPVPAPAGPPPPAPSLFPAAGPTPALDPSAFRRFTAPARPDVYNPDN